MTVACFLIGYFGYVSENCPVRSSQDWNKRPKLCGHGTKVQAKKKKIIIKKIYFALFYFVKK